MPFQSLLQSTTDRLFKTSSIVALESFVSNSNEFPVLTSAFEAAAGNIEPTQRLAKAISSFLVRLQTCNDDHINFFGGNLLGTDRIRFLDTDRAKWFDDILQIDEDYLRECVHAVPYIDKDWKVGADVFNLSCAWVVHKFYTSPHAKDPVIYQAMIDTLVILQFRFISSIYSQYFPRLVDKAAAEATYAAFTLKFNIKRMGSWGEILRNRADSFINYESPHVNALKTFQPDDKVVYIITDMQTRTRKTIKDQYNVLDKVRSGNLRIQTTQSTLTIDGDKIIKDHVNVFNNAKQYLFDVSGNEASFIKRPLVDVVLNLMSTTSEQAFLDILKMMCNEPVGTHRDEVEWMMEHTLIHAFDYIARNRIRFNDVGIILVKLRAMYISSKSTDPILLELRERIEKYAKANSHLKSPAALASVRTAIMLYFLLRAISSNQYR